MRTYPQLRSDLQAVYDRRGSKSKVDLLKPLMEEVGVRNVQGLNRQIAATHLSIRLIGFEEKKIEAGIMVTLKGEPGVWKVASIGVDGKARLYGQHGGAFEPESLQRVEE